MLRPLTLLTLLLALIAPTRAAINNVFPGDFTALPAGATSITGYYFDRRLEGPYSNGTQGGLQTHAGVTALRVSHYFDLGSLRAGVVGILNHASITATSGTLPPGSARKVSGMSDTRLGITFYPIADLEGNHHLGLNLMAILPDGSYASGEMLNPGENRSRYVATLGWIRSLGPSFTLDLIAEAGWYGDNSDPASPYSLMGVERLEQAPTQALTAYLRYHPSQALQLYAGIELNRGGSQSTDGTDLDNALHDQRHFLGLTQFLSRTRLLNLRLARHADIDNGMGYRQEVALRFIQLIR